MYYSMCVCIIPCMYVLFHVCMYYSMYVSIIPCMYVLFHVCMYYSMYVLFHVCINQRKQQLCHRRFCKYLVGSKLA